MATSTEPEMLDDLLALIEFIKAGARLDEEATKQLQNLLADRFDDEHGPLITQGTVDLIDREMGHLSPILAEKIADYRVYLDEQNDELGGEA